MTGQAGQAGQKGYFRNRFQSHHDWRLQVHDDAEADYEVDFDLEKADKREADHAHEEKKYLPFIFFYQSPCGLLVSLS